MPWSEDEDVQQLIAEHGYAICHVEGREIYAQRHIIEPPYAYTVGLTTQGKSELIVVGSFEPSLRMICLQSAVRSDEEFADWVVGKRVLQDYDVVFREVKPPCAARMAVMAARLYPAMRLLQMFLPDERGNFPWQAECDGDYCEQTFLDYASPAPPTSTGS